MKNKFYIINILLLFFISSCDEEVKNEAQSNDSLIEITKQQFNSEGMQLGGLMNTQADEKISFTGRIIPQKDAIAKISVTIPGFISSVNVQNGQYVKKNDVLLYIGGGEIIDLQQNYATSTARIKHLKADYLKVKELFNENIKTESEYLMAESEYKVELANYSALKKKILNNGLNPSDIENGNYTSRYAVLAPIAGQVGDLNIIQGKYVDSRDEIVEIIDKNKAILQLSLFEKDFGKVREDQKVEFWDAEGEKTHSEGKIIRIDPKLNSTTNTFNCYASINTEKASFAINQIVNGELFSESAKIIALPKSAVFSIGSGKYILIKKSEDNEKYFFERKKVNTGINSGNYIEILDTLGKLEILTKGSYNLSIE